MAARRTSAALARRPAAIKSRESFAKSTWFHVSARCEKIEPESKYW